MHGNKPHENEHAVYHNQANRGQLPLQNHPPLQSKRRRIRAFQDNHQRAEFSRLRPLLREKPCKPLTQHTTTMNTRRNFLRNIAVTISAPSILATKLGAEEKEELDIVKEDEPQAIALGYKEDTNDVDKEKYPQHSTDQICANCILAPVDREGDHIACTAFANRYVTKQGWCVAWVKNPG